MKEFKLVRIGYLEALQHDARTVAGHPVKNEYGHSATMNVIEYPMVAKVINSYLAQGWEIREIQENRDNYLVQFTRDK